MVFDTNESRLWLINMLKEQVVDVTFTKVNGDIRKMKCTLNSKIINGFTGIDYINDDNSIPEVTLRVFDVEAEAWRSFKFLNVTEIGFLL